MNDRDMFEPGNGQVRREIGKLLADGHTPANLARAIKRLANEIDKRPTPAAEPIARFYP